MIGKRWALYAQALVLAGCGALRQAQGDTPPIGAFDTLPHGGAMPARVSHSGSWMLPEAKREDLLYVGDAKDSVVYVYSYKTGVFVGQLSGFYQPEGMCVDKKGDVWITSDYTSQIFEYAHGGTDPLRTLNTDGVTTGCSVSPNGDLAATNYYTSSGPGDIEVWPNASGTLTSYSDPSACYLLWPAGYDNNGDLYVESQGYICELPAGGNTLSPVSFDRTIHYPSSIMWDGKHITLTDQQIDGYHTGVYRAQRNASGGLTAVGSTVLSTYGSCRGPVGQPFFVGRKNTPINDRQSKVIVGSLNCYWTEFMEYYHYTSGHSFRHLEEYVTLSGQAVSLAPR